ncbi:MAG: hypothetical protein CVU00_02155 [Bacteroidetes bacterium HGW-Bacteroidetes-17]|nr:MAG: hypothetical protein CVU00_02155 [Bacteroidetes bacterium HGW-Bacteroidetes-17]
MIKNNQAHSNPRMIPLFVKNKTLNKINKLLKIIAILVAMVLYFCQIEISDHETPELYYNH